MQNITRFGGPGMNVFCFFYPNVDISKCKTLPKGKWAVNSGLFKGVDEVESYFWQVVLKMWIDNNHVNCTNSSCTLQNN